MPQKSYDPYDLGLSPPLGNQDTKVDDPYGLGLGPPVKPEESKSNDWIEMGLRTAPAVIGGLAGGIAGIPALGLGAVGGGMAGGAAGSALGNVLGNWYAGKEFNPYEFGVETALGAVPPIFGPAKFAGKGLGAVVKYAGKTALSGAAEGALVSAGGTPFQHAAQTGSFDAPIEDYLSNALSGGLMGGVLGGGIGAYHGHGLDPRFKGVEDLSGHIQQGLDLGTPSPEPQQESLFPQPVRRYDEVRKFDELSDLGVRTPEQTTELDELRQRLGVDRIAEPVSPPGIDPFTGRFRKIPTGEPVQQGLDLSPPMDEQGQMSMFAPPPAPKPTPFLDGSMPPPPGGPNVPPPTAGAVPPPTAPPPPTGGGNAPVEPPVEVPEGTSVSADGSTVTIYAPDSTNVKYWRDRGYVLAPRIPGKASHTVMVRGDAVPRLENVTPTSAVPTEERLVAGNEVTVLNTRMNNPRFRANILNNYDIVGSDATHTKLKRKTDIRGSVMESAGPPDTRGPEEIHAHLTKMFGREPTPEEVQWAMSRQAQPGETTGRVAPFDPGFQVDTEHPANNMPPVDPTQLQDFASGIHASTQPPSDINNIRQQNVLGPHEVLPDDTQLFEPGQQELPWSRGENEGIPPLPGEGGDGGVLNAEVDPKMERSRLQVLAGRALRAGRTQEFMAYRRGIEKIDEEARRSAEAGRDMLRRIFSDEGHPDDPWIIKEGDSPELIALKQQAAEFNEYSRDNDLTPDEEAAFRDLLNKIDPESGVSEMRAPTESEARERNFLAESTGIPPDEFIRMEIGDRVAVLRNMQGSYAEHGARVANKELLQNALDETQAGGTVSVTIDYHDPSGKLSITVKDNGPGIPLEVLKNEYVTLTGSGKRGKVSHTGRKTVGEMGVGKATYLLGTDSFEIVTVAKEADGSTWKYEVNGNPDAMIGEDTKSNPVLPVKIEKTRMPDNTPTGTEVKIFDTEKKNIDAAETYLKAFAQYSDTPVNVILKSNRYNNPQWNLNATVAPRTTGVGQLVHSGSGPGGNFKLSIPPSAQWQDDGDSIVAVITARGMFQGTQTLYPGGAGRIPDHVVVDVDPTVTAQDAKNYPLTSPTRERMKDPFKDVVNVAIKDKIIKAAQAKRNADIQAAFDTLVPQPNPANPNQNLSFITNDRGGRYTQQELDNFNGNPRIQGIAAEMNKMLRHLDSLFSNPMGQHRQVARTDKFGFDLADVNKGGINITPPNDPSKSLIMVNLHSALHDAGGDPMLAGEIFAHTVLHEFTHNIARTEGAGFTWAFRGTDSAFGTARRAQVAATISKLLSGPTGGYAPDIQRLLQEHTAARGRPDTTVDFIARQAEGSVLEQPGQGGVSSSSGNARTGTTEREAVEQAKNKLTGWGKIKAVTGWGQGASKEGRQKAKEFNIVKEALAIPANLTTTGDLSAPGRQGLSLILTPEFWKAAGKMFKGLHYDSFKQMDAALRNKPLMQRPILENGKEGKSIGEQIGVKLFSPASEPGPRAEMTASRWLENLPGLGYPIRATNRAYITFLNELNVNRTEKLMNLARDMSFEALETGSARPGIFRQKFTPQEALDLNPYHNLVKAKEIVDFVNTATGHGPLKTHLLPFKQAEVSLEKAAGVLGYALFSPGLLASRLRMMNPNTYIMASPFVRKQYAKAALSTAAAWYVMSHMMKMAAGDEAEISDDITSADFGKVRLGDLRMDLGGGFGQFAVAYGRAYMGGATSSSNQEFHKFGEGYQAQTQEDMMERFFVNKLNPVAKFAWDVASASEYNQFHVGDRTVQMFVPLLIQDINELYKEDPSLVPFAAPVAALGGGTQIYSKGESVSKFIDPENDWNVSGGGIQDLMPWNWGDEDESRPFPWSER